MSREWELARVTAITDDGHRVHLELRNGRRIFASTSSDLNEAFELGTVAYLDQQSGSMEPAPDEVWTSEPWIAVVRLRLADLTLIEVNGDLKQVPTVKVPSYKVGYTVQATEAGVHRVLAESPVKRFDLTDEPDSNFRSTAGDRKLTFDDFGGSESVVARAKELVELPLTKADELRAIGAQPIKGVLFTGPPGTGKTQLARIVADQAGAAFFEVSGPEIVGKWLGESEQVLRRLFIEASAEDRAIIFFDEIDSIAPRRGGDVHEASRRLVAQLLTQMDGFDRRSNVAVIATTNRPQDIDPALLRPGRFDWEIQFSLPSEPDRLKILNATSRGLTVDGDLPLGKIAEWTSGWSGADLAGIWKEAALMAVADDRAVIWPDDVIGGYERVTVNRVHRTSREGAR